MQLQLRTLLSDIGKVLAEELRVFSMQYADAFGLFFHTWGRPPCSESIMEQTTIAYLERRYAIVRVPAIHLELFSRSSSALPRRSKACFLSETAPPPSRLR